MLLNDRIQETTTVAGTGPATLLGAVANFLPFSTVYTAASTPNVPYTIVDSTNNAWEVGLGTYTLSGATLSRDLVLDSSNSNALVNFAGATSVVFVTVSAMALTWPLEKESLDTGEIMVIPANYQQVIWGQFTMNGGLLYLFGDWVHT
jgi:hypothetical protein